jgi:glucosamine-6-phosphate deaminase
LATGSTPLPLYAQLVKRSIAGKLDFSRVRSVNLDEYVGLGPDHPQSYRNFMQKNLFDHIFIDPANTSLPDGLAGDLPLMCKEYDARIVEWGGIDLQLLGIGHNGHIGFNEPGSFFTLKTHVVKISQRTRIANARFFEDDPESVPAEAVTMGIGNIMGARKILLLVSGASKAEILYRALNEDVTPEVPASVLQLHPDVTVIADREAASFIEAVQQKCYNQ